MRRLMGEQLVSPSSSKVESSSSNLSILALIFLIGGVILLVICSIILPLTFWKHMKQMMMKKTVELENVAPALGLNSSNLQTISIFNYRTLKRVTGNFNPENQLGSGGFGPVFKGVLGDRRMIAVKKLALEKSQLGETDFLAETRMITSIQHKNLVRLLGCCSDGTERLLVYEYMINGSLDAMIYGRRDQFLNWKMRFQIILGVAQGFQYLHEDAHPRIVHSDIKASNILLDEKFQPKIGDFRLARFFPEDQTYLSTTFTGTLGYTAPEYAIRGELSVKADIYGFGVLVLEIISCRKNTNLTLPTEMQYLPAYFYERSRIVDIVDPRLQTDGSPAKDVLQVIKAAFLRLQQYPNLRPPMSELVATLISKAPMVGTPVWPTFLGRRGQIEENVSWEAISELFPSPLLSDSPSFPTPYRS